MLRLVRLLNLVVIAALVLAAAWVYEIKYAATRQTERVAKMRAEIRRERDATAALRAEWSQLDNPDRIQALARRHLTLRSIDATQFDNLDGLPDKVVPIVPPGTPDPIGVLIENTNADAEADVVTGSTSAADGAPPAGGDPTVTTSAPSQEGQQ
jgi:cell division protein FtsL